MEKKKIKSINLHGKEYAMVHDRVNAFRSEPNYNELGIQTTLEHYDSEKGSCVIKAEVKNKEGFVVASGFAHEIRTNKGVNSTSYLENCETSAIGRALACLGIGTEDAYASSFEVENAIQQQKEKETHNLKNKLKTESREEKISQIKSQLNDSILVDIKPEHASSVKEIKEILENPNRTPKCISFAQTFFKQYPENRGLAKQYANKNIDTKAMDHKEISTIKKHLEEIDVFFDINPFEMETAA